ncbi:MAG: RDD family protein [Pseudomonadota bacterium]
MWFYKTPEGEEIGPVNGHKMVALIDDGALTETTPVRRHGASTWLEAWQTDRAGYLRHDDRQLAYELAVQPASLWRRLVAFAVDIVCYGVLGYAAVMAVLTMAANLLFQDLVFVIGVWVFVPVIVTFLYFIISLASRHQASPGMRLMGMHVYRLDSKPLGLWRSVARAFVFFLSAWAVVLLVMPFLNPRRRMIHDWATGTMVVAGLPPKALV